MRRFTGHFDSVRLRDDYEALGALPSSFLTHHCAITVSSSHRMYANDVVTYDFDLAHVTVSIDRFIRGNCCLDVSFSDLVQFAIGQSTRDAVRVAAWQRSHNDCGKQIDDNSTHSGKPSDFIAESASSLIGNATASLR